MLRNEGEKAKYRNLGVKAYIRHNFSLISHNHIGPHIASSPISMKIGMDVPHGKNNHL